MQEEKRVDDEKLQVFELTVHGDDASYRTNIAPDDLIDLLCDVIEQQAERDEARMNIH